MFFLTWVLSPLYIHCMILILTIPGHSMLLVPLFISIFVCGCFAVKNLYFINSKQLMCFSLHLTLLFRSLFPCSHSMNPFIRNISHSNNCSFFFHSLSRKASQKTTNVHPIICRYLPNNSQAYKTL